MKIAVEGCMHGELDNVYATLRHLERVDNVKIDLLICCGDFQAVRNESDLESLNVKPKFRRMNSFWKYYTGQEIAPIPTIFIGGNHEASNYLWELQPFILEAGRAVDLQSYNFLKRKSHKNKFILRHMYYGGWAAPNIYFLGYAGVIKFGNVRIGGLSGIYNARHYSLGHFERPPYNESDIRSVYHVREYDVHKLMQIEDPLDVFISHDWPRGITDFGNWRKLIRQKPFFEKEIHERTLGSRAAALLLDKLKPPYWFSAHLHCKFAAAIKHEKDGQVTKFLALDKCLPRRQFLQIVEIGSDAGPYEFQYDEEWLAITRKLNFLLPLTRRPAELGTQPLDMQKHREWVRSKLTTRGAKPFEFAKAIPFSGHHCRNPQTESFLQLLELPYLLDHTSQAGTASQVSNPLGSEGEAAEQVNNEVGSADDVDELEELASG